MMTGWRNMNNRFIVYVPMNQGILRGTYGNPLTKEEALKIAEEYAHAYFTKVHIAELTDTIEPVPVQVKHSPYAG